VSSITSSSATRCARTPSAHRAPDLHPGFSGKVIYVGQKNGQGVKDFWLWELDAQGRVRNFIRAASGAFDFDERNSELILNLSQIQVETRNGKNPEDFAVQRPILTSERTSVRLPLAGLFGQSTFHPKLQWYALPELMAEWRRLAAPVPPAEQAQRNLDRMKLRMVVQDKFTMAFAVFSFALVAVPLESRCRAGNVGQPWTRAGVGARLLLHDDCNRMARATSGLAARSADVAAESGVCGVGLWLFWRVDRR